MQLILDLLVLSFIIKLDYSGGLSIHTHPSASIGLLNSASIRFHTRPYAPISFHTAPYASIRLRTPPYASICLRTPPYVRTVISTTAYILAYTTVYNYCPEFYAVEPLR